MCADLDLSLSNVTHFIFHFAVILKKIVSNNSILSIINVSLSKENNCFLLYFTGNCIYRKMQLAR